MISTIQFFQYRCTFPKVVNHKKLACDQKFKLLLLVKLTTQDLMYYYLLSL